jgi:hypothetical protein
MTAPKGVAGGTVDEGLLLKGRGEKGWGGFLG